MSTQTLIDLFGKLREDENAHKVISLLHLMLHLGAEQLEGGDQAPAPICVQTRELLEQKAIVKKLSETVDHQKMVILGQLEQKTKDMNMQVMDLHKKNTLITEMNKRLYMKCKSLEGKYEEIYHQHKNTKEELEEQRCLTLDLQQRLEKLETMKNTKDDLPGSEDVREKGAFKTEVGGLFHQVTVTNRELKKETSLILDHQQRLDRSEGVKHQDALLDTKEKDDSQPQDAQKKSSSKAGKEKEKQCKMTANPHDASEAVKGQQSSESKDASAAPQELLKLRTRNDCKDKVAACSRTGVKAKQISEDGSICKLRSATLFKAPIEKMAAERKTTADKRKPQVICDSRPNLKDTKPVKGTPLFETKKCTLPQLVNKDKTLPFQKSFLKEMLPGRGNFNRCRATVTNTVQASRQASLRNPIKVPTAKTRTFKCAPSERKPLFQHSSLQRTGANASPEVVRSERISRSPLFKVTNVVFKRDEDFSPWKHDNAPEPIIYLGEDNE